MINRRWINITLALGVGFLLPVYWHEYQTHQLVKNAKSTGVWKKIPTVIPKPENCIYTLQKQAKLLSLKLDIQSSIITVQTLDPFPIYTFLHRILQMPTLRIESFTMKRDKSKVLASIIINVINGSSIKRYAPVTKNDSFYTPRFFYVNAAAEVDGQKQIWVNGQSFGASCSWPLYHTFDSQTGTIKKGDLRPRLALTSP